MTTAIIGVGNLGGTVARHLVGGGEPVVLAGKSESRAHELANDLGPLARASSVDDAIAGADVVVLATWLDQTRELVLAASRLLEDKVVVDPSNPIGFDENGQMIRTLPEGESSGSVVAGLLPVGAHFVKALGTLAAEQLTNAANHEPRIVLFYATDDETAEAAAQHLIKTAGFEPLWVGGVSDAGRIEGPDGDLQGRILDLERARAAIRPKDVPA